MANTYETGQLLNEYLLMHYGSDEQVMPWNFGPAEALGFPRRTADYFPQEAAGRALDLGCAVGRSSFELSRNCDEVIGMDYSASFIEAAELLRKEGSLGYEIHDTGKLTTPATAIRPADARPERVHFMRGDAMDLPDDLGTFDRVHAANLICRLPDPEKLLTRLPELVSAGGYLVLATPCTWLEEYTPADCQPEGDTFQWLSELLSTHFKLVKRGDEPFLIRETARKFQWSVSLVTLWQRQPASTACDRE
jgi:putative 4-mercaptohistidine N1-methyltranferase